MSKALRISGRARKNSCGRAALADNSECCDEQPPPPTTCCTNGSTCTPTAPLVPADPDSGQAAYTKILIRLAGSISFTVTTNDSFAVPTTVNWSPPAELEAKAANANSCVIYAISPFLQDTVQVNAAHRWARFAQIGVVFYMRPGTFGDPTHCGLVFQLSAAYQFLTGGVWQSNETASFLANGGCPGGCGNARWRLLDLNGDANEGCVNGSGGGELATTGSMSYSSTGQCSGAAAAIAASVNTGVQTIGNTNTTMSLLASVNITATLAPGTVASCPPGGQQVVAGMPLPDGWALNAQGVAVPAASCEDCGRNTGATGGVTIDE